MGRYFDCVLDTQMHPVFNGSPEETRKWVLLNHYWLKDAPTFTVCPGKTMERLTVQEYLEGFSILQSKGDGNVDKVFSKQGLLFEGSPKEVGEWLIRNPSYWMNTADPCSVRIGDSKTAMTFMTAQKYLETNSMIEIENKPKDEIYLGEIVPKFYEMNPETEEVLIDGTLLKNDMIVLIEDPWLRARVQDIEKDEEFLDKARVRNRWCIVSQVQYVDGDVEFIGVYEGGLKRKRSYKLNRAWLVKLGSVPSNVAQFEKIWEDGEGASTCG